MKVPWQFCETGLGETGPSPATPRWVPRCRWTAGPRLPHMPPIVRSVVPMCGSSQQWREGTAVVFFVNEPMEPMGS
jgi:hypothetical protein